ncbi:MAG: FtsX-like permease family protein [Oscillospiraceae bacterium]|nr:FtsX-like permease family protein [Oscillospiraceae bacterium]
MYLNILKKDLKRKKTMNVILLTFIILATMFVSSSVNNIISVTTALDDYLDMADAPDYMIMTMDKSLPADVDEIFKSASSIEYYGSEKILYVSPENFIFEDESIEVLSGTNMLQSDKDLSMNYFLSDESILETVHNGEIYITSGKEPDGIEIGDKITIEIENVSREFTYTGTIKDACLGSDMNSMRRYIISAEDFESYTSEEIIKNYGGNLYYIHTNDLDKTLSEISDASKSFAFTGDRALLKFTYIFDMMVTGILLVVSIILIAIAFVVLRFTITFTLSEEFREIGVMKAIGISNLKIRGLYLVKYAGLSVIGSIIGLVLSFPFAEMLMSVTSKSIIISNQNPIFINILCAVFVVAVILLFCYGCTGKVKKLTPIDAIRNGQTGERFRKKSLMSLGKSKLGTTSFLALNDIVSAPKRYSIITLTFVLCLSLLLIFSNTVYTMNSGTLIHAFGMVDCDVVMSNFDMEFVTEDGRDKLKDSHKKIEEKLAENGMPAKCVQETYFTLSVTYGENKIDIPVQQNTGTTMDMYKYTAGSAPQNTNEIVITRMSAEMLGANIGDTVTINTIDGDKEYIITAFYQNMNNFGEGIILHCDEEINYVQAIGSGTAQIIFTDNPDKKEILNRIDKIEALYPEAEDVKTSEDFTADMLSVTDVLDTVKSMVTILTIVLTALITVLMERSFIAKETGEIALMKAIGTRSGKIYAYHAMRFAIVGIIAVIVAEIFAMPLTHLCIDPIFKMMGMELAVDYVINPVELFIVFPLVILVTTTASAYLTSLYTRKIKSSDTANIE